MLSGNYFSSLFQRALRDLLAMVVWALWMQFASVCLARAQRLAASVDRTIGRISWASWSAAIEPPTTADVNRSLRTSDRSSGALR